MDQAHLKRAGTVATVILGNVFYAFVIKLFLLPGNLMTGGTTGIGLVVKHFTGTSISGFVLVFNIVMLIVGWTLLGKKFALTTVISSFTYPIALEAANHIFGDLVITTDPMLNTIFAGLGIGIGLGIVIRTGASTGGMDIPPLVLNKKFGLPVSVMLYVFDFIILISQMLFTNKEEIVYGILLVLIYTVILDKVLLMGSTRTKVEIMTEKYEELNRLIQERLDRGTTLVYTQTGYLKNDQPMILTVVSNRELMRLNQLVQEIDPHAFMIIGNVNEVRGRGFSQQKVYKKETIEK